MPSRRHVLLGGGAAVMGGPALAAPDADAALAALLARHMEEHLAASPETAAAVLTGARGRAARARLDDRSPEAKAAQVAAARRWRAELRGIDRGALGEARRMEYDTAAFAYEMLEAVGARYGFQDHALRPGPYLVNQMAGAYYWQPQDFSRAPAGTREDADLYLSRLADFARVLDGETRGIVADARAGVAPPDFVLTRTIGQLSALRTGAAASLADGPAARAAAAGLADVGPAARRTVERQVVPALQRQIEALQALQRGASSEAGVWRLPDGETWYALALRSNTTVATPPEEMHRLGLDTFEALRAELDARLRAQGLGEGSVAQRIRALDQDPRLLKPNTEAGRADILQFSRDHLNRVHGLLPRAFRTLPDRDITVDRIPPAIEAGAPGAYYEGPPADGSRPGVISINLKDTAEWPIWRLKTLIHHEGDPGHHLQHAVFRRAGGDKPLYRQFAQYSAYVEGWALYAEQVAVEIGAYEDDPFGEIGAVQSALFRAARIVVDTGIHHKRWSRAEATHWMIENAGEQAASAQREINRYCVYPGQACAFMVGRLELLRTREAARRRQGSAFDVHDWHERVLAAGPMPMEVLARTMA
ncbi:DUF885 domain-containing protein [Phenylobacterium sp.]|uniref:DUF885 domain-containing protein n=1 Tax=Phenylobacterium sp. TaxID=1871053 RepID=UPI002B79ADD7|nr:DUF885 domain-containing protein [Phenylobacterium sp.]HVI33126.1 DUF885 domain-containing protein [Phenylobacterium sp.]